MHNFNSGEAWYHIVHELSDISIIKQILLKLNPKPSRRTQMQPETTHIWSRRPIFWPFLNVTNV